MGKDNATKAFKYFNLSLNCSEKELKKNYFNKIKNLHPDKHLYKNISIQKKYSNEFLEAHRQFQIAISFLKKKRNEKDKLKYDQEDNPFNNLNKNNRQSYSSTISSSNFFFKNIKLTKVLFYLKKSYFLFSIPFIIYFIENIIDTKNCKNTNDKEDYNFTIKINKENNKRQDSNILRNELCKSHIGNVYNEKKDALSLFKLRYIFNVVKIRKAEKKPNANYINRNIFEEEKNDLNYLKKQILFQNKMEDINIFKDSKFLNHNKMFFDDLLENKKISMNLVAHPKNVLQNFIIFSKEISNKNSFNYNIISFSNFKKNSMKKEDKVKKIKHKNSFLKKNIDNNPLYKNFLLSENRGIHNESRYINGIGGLCGGYNLIKGENEQINEEGIIKKEKFLSKDMIYMNEIRNNELIDDLINLQNSIIYEKSKYINFSNPLKYIKYRRGNKINLNNYFKCRNCKINLKDTNFRNNIKKHTFNNLNNQTEDKNFNLSHSLDKKKN
ncbi:DnaJ protein, putative [Plasmodium gallinaceum]|uniref:DnaJ protein, putative n=1 Tax=Plasmodium gallinaceum TaxID=5849 RepID=A0A1J1H2P2_PLAGA|nr:DnaJ protein, putative [Plasmodium gallinaceum]CRG97614.1 DnaJ protein, putative [Plasmodium gallinaceum]